MYDLLIHVKIIHIKVLINLQPIHYFVLVKAELFSYIKIYMPILMAKTTHQPPGKKEC